MHKRLLIAFLCGMLLGGLLGQRPVIAQTAQRLYGTFSGGAKAALVDSSGRLRVVGS